MYVRHSYMSYSITTTVNKSKIKLQLEKNGLNKSQSVSINQQKTFQAKSEVITRCGFKMQDVFHNRSKISFFKGYMVMLRMSDNPLTGYIHKFKIDTPFGVLL